MEELPEARSEEGLAHPGGAGPRRLPPGKAELDAELDAAEEGGHMAEQAGAAAGGGEGKEAEGGREGAPAFFSDSHHLKIS